MFELVQDTDSLPLFVGQTFVIICSALPIVLVDRFFQNYRDKYESNMSMRNMFNFIQLLVNILYVYLIMILYKNFSKHYQKTIPGMFFSSFLFSLQYGLFIDVHENIKKTFLPPSKI